MGNGSSRDRRCRVVVVSVFVLCCNCCDIVVCIPVDFAVRLIGGLSCEQAARPPWLLLVRNAFDYSADKRHA